MVFNIICASLILLQDNNNKRQFHYNSDNDFNNSYIDNDITKMEFGLSIVNIVFEIVIMFSIFFRLYKSIIDKENGIKLRSIILDLLSVYNIVYSSTIINYYLNNQQLDKYIIKLTLLTLIINILISLTFDMFLYFL